MTSKMCVRTYYLEDFVNIEIQIKIKMVTKQKFKKIKKMHRLQLRNRQRVITILNSPTPQMILIFETQQLRKNLK